MYSLYITKFPIGSIDKHQDLSNTSNFTMSAVSSSSELTFSTSSGSLGSETSYGSIDDVTLTFSNDVYSHSTSGTCSSSKKQSFDSQEAVSMVSSVRILI